MERLTWTSREAHLIYSDTAASLPCPCDLQVISSSPGCQGNTLGFGKNPLVNLASTKGFAQISEHHPDILDQQQGSEPRQPGTTTSTKGEGMETLILVSGTINCDMLAI